jgi:hypothetical protein
MPVTDFTEFLAKRLDEYERRICHALAFQKTPGMYQLSVEDLADINAKRVIIGKLKEAEKLLDKSGHDYDDAIYWSVVVETYRTVLAELSKPFIDHPDYPGEEVHSAE